MLFTRPKRAIGIDVGTHSIKAIQMSRAGGRFRIDAAGYALVDRNKVNVDPIAAQASAVREAIRTMPLNQSLVVGALPGQTVVIRYPKLPDMPESRIGESIESEAGQNIPYDLSEVFLDWVLLDTAAEGDERMLKVLLVAAKHEVIDARIQIAQAAEISYGVLTVDSVSMADAAESCDFLRVGETVALVNIGLTSASIHFVKDGVSNFIRDVNWGARELIQAVAKSKRVDYEQAEKMLCSFTDESTHHEEEDLLDLEDTQPDTDRDVNEADTVVPAQPEPVGSSLLDPFEDELGGGGGAVLEPAGIVAGSTSDLESVFEAPLSRLVTEVRRSFDYYEHGLYETPVNRLILSGGIAPIPLLRTTLKEELGLENVEVADPSESALVLGSDNAIAPLLQRPAQFMVAIGLAARGTADL